MPYIICEPCISTKDKACVGVCPVDCIHEGVATDSAGTTYDMLFISPDECIDCGQCEPECPVSAIFADTDVPEKWQHFTEINAAFFKK